VTASRGFGDDLDQIVERFEGGFGVSPPHERLVGTLGHHGDDVAQSLRGIGAEMDRLPERDVRATVLIRQEAPPRDHGTACRVAVSASIAAV
jgi:hypothetical protein